MSGEVYANVGEVLAYWRKTRLQLTEEELIGQLKLQWINLEYPGGPYGLKGTLYEDEISVDEWKEWESGLSNIEFWGLLIRDIATAFGIPTRRVLSKPPGHVPENIQHFRKTLLQKSTQEFSEQLEIPHELYLEIENGETDLERVGRIFMALAMLTEEPVFNFWRPGHHIERRTLEWLEKSRIRDKEEKETREREKKLEAEREAKLKAEQLARIEARKKRLEEIERQKGQAS